MTKKVLEDWGLTLFFVGIQIGLFLIMYRTCDAYSCIAPIVFILLLVWANLIRLKSLRKTEDIMKNLDKIMECVNER